MPGPGPLITDTDAYYMNIAVAVRKKAKCLGRKVGAVLVRDNRIVSTGYNGTPAGMPNCTDGGCVRCRERQTYSAGYGYDVCICVHAEANALISAARFGIATEGGTLYSTLRPCFDCSKSALQAKVQRVVYLHDWAGPNDAALREQYESIQAEFELKRLEGFEDPDAEWAGCG